MSLPDIQKKTEIREAFIIMSRKHYDKFSPKKSTSLAGKVLSYVGGKTLSGVQRGGSAVGKELGTIAISAGRMGLVGSAIGAGAYALAGSSIGLAGAGIAFGIGAAVGLYQYSASKFRTPVVVNVGKPDAEPKKPDKPAEPKH